MIAFAATTSNGIRNATPRITANMMNANNKNIDGQSITEYLPAIFINLHL